MVLYGPLSFPRVPFMDLCGPIWSPMGQYTPVWFSLIRYGPIQSSLSHKFLYFHNFNITVSPEITGPKTICLQGNVPWTQPAPEIICPGKQIAPEDTLHRAEQDSLGISRNKLGLRLAKLKLF